MTSTPRCPYCQAPRLRCKRDGRLGATCGGQACRMAALQQGRARHQVKPRRRRLCACGCGQRVRQPRSKYLLEHVPTEARREGGRRGRRSYAFKRRMIRYRKVLDQMTAGGRKITTEAILDAFAEVGRYEYHIGYHACEVKWLGRKFGARKATAA